MLRELLTHSLHCFEFVELTLNYDKFMNWLCHQLWSEKLGKTIHVEQPKVAKV